MVIANIDDATTRVVTSFVVHIVGETTPHRIIGGVMLLVERAMAGTPYCWVSMMLTRN